MKYNNPAYTCGCHINLSSEGKFVCIVGHLMRWSNKSGRNRTHAHNSISQKSFFTWEYFINLPNAPGVIYLLKTVRQMLKKQFGTTYKNIVKFTSNFLLNFELGPWNAPQNLNSEFSDKIFCIQLATFFLQIVSHHSTG